MLALKAENISKLYRLGQVGTGTLSHDLNRFWHKFRGKDDPYLKIGEANDRATKGESEYVWSLRDINFQVEQGDAVGIIGRNGAGKSTLLKLLSKVTKPTTGNIHTLGRIASLLEVGTGFHPEMTGRENIYLNGAILGMSRKEIKRKFDEIVDFSGVERYIDTPVKRYSSGMYVRLAFAVAAHLESEILIVDEVLAVGDAEFQKKCLGKMNDVTKGEGRTILFVSHNLAAVNNLCDRGILLHHGKLMFDGTITETIQRYTKEGSSNDKIYIPEIQKINSFDQISIQNEQGAIINSFQPDEDIYIYFSFELTPELIGAVEISFRIADKLERIVFSETIPINKFDHKNGKFQIRSKIRKNFLVPNFYNVLASIHIPNVRYIDYQVDVVNFTVEETGSLLHLYSNIDYGCVFANCQWYQS